MKFLAPFLTLFLFASFTMKDTKLVESASYSFKNSLDIKMSSYKKNGKLDDETNATLLISDEDPLKYFGVELDLESSGMGAAIYDYDKQKMITLMNLNGNNQAVIIDMNKKLFQPDEDDYDESVEFVKTGNSKDILGYSCDEYKAVVDDGTNYFWVSATAPLGIIDFFIRVQNQKSKNKIETVMPEGSVLELSSVSEKGEKFVMQVTKINQNINKTIDLSNYSVIGRM